MSKGHKHAPDLDPTKAQPEKTLSAEHRRAIARGLRAAYAEGRRKPVRSSHRAGTRLTQETKAQISAALQGHVPWNKGVKTGPMDPEVVRRRALAQTGTTRAVTQAVLDGRLKNSEAHKGKVQSAETRAKRAASLRLAYAEGRKSTFSGYGKGCWYPSPCQGDVWLRSTSELQYARELDAEGLVWFYEVRRYSVRIGDHMSSYMPDFWIAPGVTKADIPIDVCPRTFLDTCSHEVVDIKGWWKSTHKTFHKVTAFAEQHPEIKFRVVVRPGLSNVP